MALFTTFTGDSKNILLNATSTHKINYPLCDDFSRMNELINYIYKELDLIEQLKKNPAAFFLGNGKKYNDNIPGDIYVSNSQFWNNFESFFSQCLIHQSWNSKNSTNINKEIFKRIVQLYIDIANSAHRYRLPMMNKISSILTIAYNWAWAYDSRSNEKEKLLEVFDRLDKTYFIAEYNPLRDVTRFFYLPCFSDFLSVTHSNSSQLNVIFNQSRYSNDSKFTSLLECSYAFLRYATFNSAPMESLLQQKKLKPPLFYLTQLKLIWTESGDHFLLYKNIAKLKVLVGILGWIDKLLNNNKAHSEWIDYLWFIENKDEIQHLIFSKNASADATYKLANDPIWLQNFLHHIQKVMQQAEQEGINPIIAFDPLHPMNVDNYYLYWKNVLALYADFINKLKSKLPLENSCAPRKMLSLLRSIGNLLKEVRELDLKHLPSTTSSTTTEFPDYYVDYNPNVPENINNNDTTTNLFEIHEQFALLQREVDKINSFSNWINSNEIRTAYGSCAIKVGETIITELDYIMGENDSILPKIDPINETASATVSPPPFTLSTKVSNHSVPIIATSAPELSFQQNRFNTVINETLTNSAPMVPTTRSIFQEMLPYVGSAFGAGFLSGMIKTALDQYSSNTKIIAGGLIRASSNVACHYTASLYSEQKNTPEEVCTLFVASLGLSLIFEMILNAQPKKSYAYLLLSITLIPYFFNKNVIQAGCESISNWAGNVIGAATASGFRKLKHTFFNSSSSSKYNVEACFATGKQMTTSI